MMVKYVTKPIDVHDGDMVVVSKGHNNLTLLLIPLSYTGIGFRL